MGATDPAATVGVASLREGFEGAVLLPTDPGYDEARVLFNAMIDRRPAAIAQCASPDDVARAIGLAREHDLDLSVRGGGHGVAGTALAEGGLVVDLRRMCAVDVDPEARTARVGGGATMSHLDRACQPYDLATTGGRVSTTGVGGFTLGGGTGWLDRKFGLACDNLLSVELVTAAGEQVVASDAEHPDLFWALHGGGGNFGVATALTFRLHEVPTATLALLMWRPAEAEQVLRAVRDLFEGGPDEIGGGALWMTAPEEEFVPAQLAGHLVCAAVVVFAGPEAGARDVIAHPFGLWADPADDARVIGWTRELRSAVQPWATGAVYLNFIGDEGADRVRAGLGEQNYQRLVGIKQVWDPDNVFRRNHNIAPAPA